jgi:hypothetical protein
MALTPSPGKELDSMRRSPILPLLLLAMIGVLSGCAEPPEAEAQRAQEAVQTVRDAEAATYAPEALRGVETALVEAQQEIQTQNERFAIMRDYEEAEKMLATVQQTAADAREEATAKKEEARLEAETRYETASQSAAAAAAALEEAPRGKGTRADIAALTADLEAIQGELVELVSQIEAEEYFAAQDKADALIASAEAISEEIQIAVETQERILSKRRNR